MVQSLALVYRLVLSKRNESGAQAGELRGLIRALILCPDVPPELPESKKYLNAL